MRVKTTFLLMLYQRILMKIKIGNKFIGEGNPAFIVAEAGINHNGDLKIAKKLIQKAKDSGADAIKFQTFRAEDLTSRKSKFFKIFKRIELDFSDYLELYDFAKSKNIIFFSTPFSDEAVDLLKKIKIPAFKIASGDLTDIPLIKYVAKTKKPIILSTGMANINEISSAIKAIKNCNNNKIILMHSVSSYPTPISDVNLHAITTLKEKYPYPIGFSDNGGDLLVPVISIAVGAKIVEKHFTVDKKLPGPDHKFSTNPKQFQQLVTNIRNTEKMLGDGIKKCKPSELINRVEARRSVTSLKMISKNCKIQRHMIGVKRPAKGIEPKYYHKVIGKIARRDIKIDDPVNWNDLK